MFIARITSKSPEKSRTALKTPETEARRANLDPDMPLWVVFDELNADVPETFYTLEERQPAGHSAQPSPTRSCAVCSAFALPVG